MNRKKLIYPATACAALFTPVIETYATEKPNIIYVLADDLGYGELSCYGQQKFVTPNIDRLAKEGVRFTQHYAGSTVCAPSRCCLMTGLHTGHAQIRDNVKHKPLGQLPVKPGTRTIPTLLKKAGYVTGAFGKWGLGYPGSSGDPSNYFDEFYGYICQSRAHNYYPAYLWHNRKKVELDGKTYSHDLIMQAAFNFIKKNRDKKFFCYIPVQIPHTDMQAPEKLHEKYRKQFPQFENVIRRKHGRTMVNAVAAFPAMVEHLDNNVGELMTLLKKLDLDKNTIVIFASDNGPHQAQGHQPKFWNSGGGLRGIKRDLYEGGIRIPMIARWPGHIKPGTTSDHLSAFWDVMPTLCDLAGIKAPAGIDGISFAPTLLGKGVQKKHPYLYWEYHSSGGKQALRKGKWKAVRLKVGEEPNSPLELFDLDEDPQEKHNVAGKHPQIVKELSALMAEARTTSPVFNFKPRKNIK